MERGHTIELDLRAFRGPGLGRGAGAAKGGAPLVPPLTGLARIASGDVSPRPRAVSSPSRKTTSHRDSDDSGLDLSFLYAPTETDTAASPRSRATTGAASPAALHVRSRATTEEVVQTGPNQTRPNVQAMVHAVDSRDKTASRHGRGRALPKAASRSAEQLEGGDSFNMQQPSTSFQVRMAAAAGANVFAKRVSEGGLLDASGEVDLGALRSPRPQGSTGSLGPAWQRPTVRESLAPNWRPKTAGRESLPVGPAWRGPVADAAAAAAAADTEAGSSGPSNGTAQGPCYNHHIWAYYCYSGAWSDGMCAAIQKVRLALSLFCPPLWFWRLYLTLHRAAPLDPGCGDSCRVTRDSALGAAAAALGLLVLGCCIGGGLGGVLVRIDENLHFNYKVLMFAAAFLPSLYAGGLFWAWLLRAVGEKYNIGQVQRNPQSFLLKATCCLCAMNVRVGLHVDRAQGFLKPSRAVRDMVAMAESVGLRKSGIVQAPMMSAMRSPSEELLKDMEEHGVRRTLALDAAQRRTIELGVMRDFSAKPAKP